MVANPDPTPSRPVSERAVDQYNGRCQHPVRLLVIWCSAFYGLQGLQALMVGWSDGRAPWILVAGILTAITSFVGFMGLIFWLTWLRPHSRMSFLLPLALLLLPSALTLIRFCWFVVTQAPEWDLMAYRLDLLWGYGYQLTEWVSAGSLMFLFSRSTGFQLHRAGQPADESGFHILSLMVLTATVAIAMAVASVTLRPSGLLEDFPQYFMLYLALATGLMEASIACCVALSMYFGRWWSQIALSLVAIGIYLAVSYAMHLAIANTNVAYQPLPTWIHALMAVLGVASMHLTLLLAANCGYCIIRVHSSPHSDTDDALAGHQGDPDFAAGSNTPSPWAENQAG